ncbi:MAG: thymidine kinase [Bacilli bacterium]|nr:thymidine kinase [Bacilli bacterium]
MKQPYLKFCFGAMGCGKTRKLQGDYYSKVQDGFEAIVIKPSIDVKGDNNTLARDGGSVETTFLINKKDNIYIKIANYLLEHNLDFILVDEAQFLEGHHVEELSNVVDILGINVICYGLRTDFKGNLFEGSKRLFEMADPLEPIIRQCSCGNNKIYNMRLYDGVPVFEGEQVAIDGVDATYESVCRKCYKDAKKKVLSRSKVKEFKK